MVHTAEELPNTMKLFWNEYWSRLTT